jgi:threonine 3-dehydrogenase
MTELVTGGTGLVGREVGRQLIERGEDVVLFDISPREKLWADIRDKVKFVRGDLSNWSSVLNAVKDCKPESIFHMGSMLSVPSNADPWSAYRVNANGMMHVLEAARLFDVGKVIFTSSQAAVMCPEVTDVITDFTLQRPRIMYGVTKVFAELLGRFYNTKFGLDFRAVRYDSIIGPGVKTMGVVQCFPWSIEHALKNEQFDMWVPEESGMGVTYFKDAARAVIDLHDAPKENIKTMVYNTKGISLTAREFVDAVRKHLPEAKIGFKPDPEIAKMMGKGIPEVDDSRAREEWGWHINYPLDEMIDDYVKEFRSKREMYE